MSSIRDAAAGLADRLMQQDRKRTTVSGIALIALSIAVVAVSAIGPRTAGFFVVAVGVSALSGAAGLILVLVGSGNMWKADEREQAINVKAGSNAWVAIYALMWLWTLYGWMPFNNWLYANLSVGQIVYFSLPVLILIVSGFIWAWSLKAIKKDKGVQSEVE